jgi:hypothetical protein
MILVLSEGLDEEVRLRLMDVEDVDVQKSGIAALERPGATAISNLQEHMK